MVIQFSQDIGFWSKFVFWYVALNALGTLIFLMVVVVGGIVDLKFLFRSLRETAAQEAGVGSNPEPSQPEHPQKL